MKGIRNSKMNSKPKVLQQQSEKLKDKLQQLRQQVNNKKQEKQLKQKIMNNTVNDDKNINIFLQSNKNAMRKTQYCKDQDDQLHNICLKLKIENAEYKLIEKGIKNYNDFIQIKIEQIDTWKDIPVGYRIKIKKQISNYQQKSKFTTITEQIEQKVKIPEQIEQSVQQIINRRNISKIYVPIIGRQVQSQNLYQERFLGPLMDQQQQDLIIKSLKSVFAPRKGILKKSKKSSEKKISLKVKWQSTVIQFEQNISNKNKYPKQLNPKKLTSVELKLINQQFKTQSKKTYCWMCLKQFFQLSYSLKNRQFCSQQCQKSYSIKLNTSYSKNSQMYQNKQDQIDENNVNEIEVIDLSIQ